MQTRTGGVKPTVAKVVNDALAADILAGGAGIVLRTYAVGFHNNSDERSFCETPQLPEGSYSIKAYMEGDVFNNANEAQVAIGLRLLNQPARIAVLSFKLEISHEQTNEVFTMRHRNGDPDIVVSPISLVRNGTATREYVARLDGQVRLDAAGTIELYGYTISGGNNPPSTVGTARFLHGHVEVIKVSDLTNLYYAPQ